jgi:hypothetical protein
MVSEWAKLVSNEDSRSKAEENAPGAEHLRAIVLFQDGTRLYRRGLDAEALVKWKEGMALEPDNLVIRKR